MSYSSDLDWLDVSPHAFLRADEVRHAYQKRYVEDDDGLRFTDLVYKGNFTEAYGYTGRDATPITDGISGDREVKRRAKTKVLERLSKDDVLRDQLTVDEMNDLINYVGWNIWDVLAMRATEGASGMIPRQEYEALAVMQNFLRWPEFFELITQTVGPGGVVRLGETGAREIGTKVNNLRTWDAAGGFLMGYCLLQALEWAKPGDFVRDINIGLKFFQRISYGFRHDGYILSSQDRSRAPSLYPYWIERMEREAEALGGEDAPKRMMFRDLNAVASLLGFFIHFDCRMGMGDSGPYELGDGRLMIVRDYFLREDVYHWSDVAEDLPHAVTAAFIIDAGAMGLEEIRCNDISTMFTRPKNYLPFVTHAAIYVRQNWDTPIEDIVQLPLADTPDIAARARVANLKLYRKMATMSRRELITNGIYVYYIDMLLPWLRLSGTYDTACADGNLWELDRRVSEAYYEITRRNFVQEVVPQKIFSGTGYVPIPKVAETRGKWAWL